VAHYFRHSLHAAAMNLLVRLRRLILFRDRVPAFAAN
jgi:hypothetical protein